ncbi:hypothetical protein RI129_007926 [Pyrocoelia pectoralis]|uniref:Transforming acidic coiled-coil-containing protein C-terminal domain-containing protein n=1 Tax=Pyrocoelia pectoralis TaxID=417401 RepID=A0AAN7VEH2_9COLE
MSIIRIIQESDLIKNNTMFSLKAVDTELDKMEEIIKEKDVIIHNNCEKMQELEAHIAELEESLQEARVKNEIEARATDDQIFLEYDKFIHEIMTKYEIAREQRNVVSNHLACLEAGFTDLVEKYERLKTVIVGYQENQAVLLSRLAQEEENIEVMQKRYDKLKDHTNNKLREANAHVVEVHAKHAEDITQIKTQLQVQKDKIVELEQNLVAARGDVAAQEPKKLLPSIINTFKFY